MVEATRKTSAEGDRVDVPVEGFVVVDADG